MKSREVPVEGWHKVVHFNDEVAGLDALIAVHDATLGPGCGGCRVRNYESFEAGLEDVKNLSRGMTFKNALGGIPFGGGKAVIFADPKKDKTPALFRAFGRAVESLGGLYYTAEDSGVTEEDLALVRAETDYAAGLSEGGVGGNPSPFTARGVWRGIKAAAQHKFGDPSLKGKTVSILGVGAVGMSLAELIHKRAVSWLSPISMRRHWKRRSENLARKSLRRKTPSLLMRIFSALARSADRSIVIRSID